MISHSKLYPLRLRETNIGLIKDIVYSNSLIQHEEAIGVFSDNLHPSLYAELDWMEITMPTENSQQVADLVDYLFLNNLEKILLMRRIEFDLEGAELHVEIVENHEFYQYIFENEPEVSTVLGPELSRRLKHAYYESQKQNHLHQFNMYDEEKRIRQLLYQVGDREIIPLLIEVEIKNAIAILLDHVSSRMRTKKYIRFLGGKFPNLSDIGNLGSKTSINELEKKLKKIYEQSKQYNLFRLSNVSQIALDYLRETDILSLDKFEGERAAGYGHCGNCSMMYASSAVISLDTTCPFLFEKGTDMIYLPMDLNTSRCPFCGEKQRVSSPAMFYSPKRKSVIYCTPTIGQYSEEEAEEVHRPLINEIRERYKNRISVEEAQAFDAAIEEVTYDGVSFLRAIQMGTADNVRHAFIIVRLIDGVELIFDTTTGVMIELTSPSELSSLWDINVGEEPGVQQIDQLQTDIVSIDNALSAYSDGNYELARDILEEKHEQSPYDKMIRNNLATVYLALGDKNSAIKILG